MIEINTTLLVQECDGRHYGYELAGSQSEAAGHHQYLKPKAIKIMLCRSSCPLMPFWWVRLSFLTFYGIINDSTTLNYQFIPAYLLNSCKNSCLDSAS